MGMIDLHTHSNASDGILSPEGLVDLAVAAGVDALALTDHDTAGGIDAFVAAGKATGLEVVPGVEISTEHALGSLHILGYYVDWKDPSFRKVLDANEQTRRGRTPRAGRGRPAPAARRPRPPA